MSNQLHSFESLENCIDDSNSTNDVESQTTKVSVGTNTNPPTPSVFFSSMKVKKRTSPNNNTSRYSSVSSYNHSLNSAPLDSVSSLSHSSSTNFSSTISTTKSKSSLFNKSILKSNKKSTEFLSSSLELQNISSKYQLNNSNSMNKNLTIYRFEADNLTKSIAYSYFAYLGGILETILKSNILLYLSASDLIKLSKVSRFFYRITQSPCIWSFLYTSDFLYSDYPEELIMIPSDIKLNTNILKYNKEGTLTHKQIYIMRYQEYQNRFLHSNREKLEIKNAILRITNGHTIENLLDLSQVRFLPPLILSSIFLSLVLYCQKVDGLPIPFWVAAVPLSVALFYSMINLVVVRIVHRASLDSQNDKSIFKNIWENFHSPLVYIYKELLGENTRLYYTFLCVLGLMVVQLALVVLKLTIPSPHRDDLSWGCVFLPIWIFFGLFIISPCTKFQMNLGVFILSFFVFWIPLFILFVCLATKFDNQEKMRLSLIFIPFYVVEGLIMLSTLMVFISGLYRFRKGLIDKIDEYLAIFLVSWAILSPLVVFEALLSVRDEYSITRKGPEISATESVTPLLIMLGWFTLIVTYLSCTYQTKFNENRERSMEQAAGLTNIHNF